MIDMSKLLDYIYLSEKKIMEHKISFMIIIATLIVSVFLGFTIVGPIIVNIIYPKTNAISQNNNNTIPQQNETLPPVQKQTYVDDVTFSQQTEQLNGEVVQYEITFHNDTAIYYDMNISYQLTSTGTVFYLIYLTDGKQLTKTIHISDEGCGKLIDVTTFLKHRKVGKNINKNGETSLSDSIQVTNNTVWYLTFAVARSTNESISVVFKTKKECMEIKSLGRKDSVTLVSALNADYKDGKFIGRYRGYSLFGIGASHGSVNKEIPVTNGGIICVDMKNYYQGMMKVSTISGSKSSESYEPGEASILLSTTDNNTKTWLVEANTFGFPKKSSILTFVVDVNPHSSITVNDWNGTKPQTIENRLDSLSTKLMQWGITKLIKIFTREK